MTKTIGTILLAAFVSGLTHFWYVENYGYSVERVEADICGGNWLIEPAGNLRCLTVPKSKPLPAQFKPYTVRPGTRFKLGKLDELCPLGTKPQQTATKLKCLP